MLNHGSLSYVCCTRVACAATAIGPRAVRCRRLGKIQSNTTKIHTAHFRGARTVADSSHRFSSLHRTRTWSQGACSRAWLGRLRGRRRHDSAHWPQLHAHGGVTKFIVTVTVRPRRVRQVLVLLQDLAHLGARPPVENVEAATKHTREQRRQDEQRDGPAGQASARWRGGVVPAGQASGDVLQ